MIPSSLRSPKMYAKYKAEKKDHNVFNTLPSLESFKYWKIVPNEFPYDRIASRHDLLIPRRKIADIFQLSQRETTELRRIMKMINKQKRYDAILFPFHWSRTIRTHLHFHLLRIK